jgi:hypothetical protein
MRRPRAILDHDRLRGTAAGPSARSISMRETGRAFCANLTAWRSAVQALMSARKSRTRYENPADPPLGQQALLNASRVAL